LAGKLDKLDLRLLACLQESNLQTADQLAEQVGRSPSAIARRLRRLRASDVILAERAVISEEAAGFPLSAVVHVQFEHHAMHEVEQFRRRVCASPNVQLCLNLAGAFDILLLVVAENMDSYNAFTASLLERRPVRRFETTLVKKRVKATLALPIGASL
jgi:Lrp/AsnC family leucine-responsive transcriptional regulator